MNCKSLRYILLLLVAIASHKTLFAQFELGGPPRSGKSATVTMRTQNATPISLPFFDDFSTVTDDNPGPLWVNSNSVMISKSAGRNIPTINIATFDGLNAAGEPYSKLASDFLTFGYTDTLSSVPIKMTEVTVPKRNTVYLSFFYQWGGNGEPPDERDFMLLQFLANDDTWRTIETFTSSELTLDEFELYSVQITDAVYFHDNFQFRFIAHGRISGYYDVWNIDYVFLNQNRTANEFSFSDRTTTKSLSPLFGDYYAIPINHFRESQLITPPSFEVYNLRADAPTPLSYTTKVEFQNYESGLLTTQVIDPVSGSQGIPDVDPLDRATNVMNAVTLPVFTDFDANADSVYMKLTLRLATNDFYDSTNPTSDYDSARFYPIDLRMNDSTSQVYTLNNYYAYDDGTAEQTAGLIQGGNEGAIRFEMQTPEQDTLNGLQLYFAYFAGQSPSTVEFFILGDDNGQPGSPLLEELVPVRQQPLNTFYTHKFMRSVIVNDVFYVGWRQLSNNQRVRFGMDTDNNTTQHIFFRETATSAWQLGNLIDGSLMIRPMFGPGEITTGTNEDEERITLFPNPNQGVFYLDATIKDISITAATGQRVAFETEVIENKTRVTLQYPATGVYIVRYRFASTIMTSRIVVIN